MSMMFQLPDTATLQQIKDAMRILGTESFTFNILESDKPSFLVQVEPEQVENPETVVEVSKVQEKVEEIVENRETVEKKDERDDENTETDDDTDTETTAMEIEGSDYWYGHLE